MVPNNYLFENTDQLSSQTQQYEYRNCYLATLWFDNFCHAADRNFLGALRSIPKSLEYNFAGFFRYYWKNVGNICFSLREKRMNTQPCYFQMGILYKGKRRHTSILKIEEFENYKGGSTLYSSYTITL